MPKRKDIKKILLIGSGPIVIGQACEFDYSGTQAVKALKEEGYKVILVNSNPATIMTDPELADKTYIEPLSVPFVEKIIAKERPDALLPTMGGQTALNLALMLAKKGVLRKYKVELIGAKEHAIKKAEDRSLFKKAMTKIGLEVPKSGYAKSLQEAKKIAKKIKFPLIIRPSFTLGGEGSAPSKDEIKFAEKVNWGLRKSPVHEILIEESLIGWKEFELEVMRDLNDNVIIICSIENFDPMGIHTGDSITVAPAQTLTDQEYQMMRDASIKIIREIGVETGGSNIQFALNPDNGHLVIIEMNPRVSRSSALASKATGFPIAKIAAKLSVGYTLDEIPNDITKKTPASFEPVLDYVVTKVPRFAFEKFYNDDQTLNTSMKSIGEVMAIGRTFKESLQKAIRGLEIKRFGLGGDGEAFSKIIIAAMGLERQDITRILDEIKRKIEKPNCDRIFNIKYGLSLGLSIDEIHEMSKIDKWFLYQIKELIEIEDTLKYEKFSPALIRTAKENGFSDHQIAYITKRKEIEIRKYRMKKRILPTYKLVDTCSAEFPAYTPYYYSTYEMEDEVEVTKKPKVLIIGSGPNRIGQGIEFDACCVHCSMALREIGIESIMVNSNPETVSTDYDISDKLYFEPLTLEDILNIYEKEKPLGVIVQFGGQTSINLTKQLEKYNVKILGTNSKYIDIAEDRAKYSKLMKKLKIPIPAYDVAYNIREAVEIVNRIGYPVMIRPSYVLGGRGMETLYNKDMLINYFKDAVSVNPEHPVLIDKFLQNAKEVDVDALCDGKEVYIGGIMEHIEEAGIHSGDSACSLPPYSFSKNIVTTIEKHTKKIALSFKTVGLLNIQFAVKNKKIYTIEVNPRASRTVPFVSKVTGVPLAKIATKIILGKKIKNFKLKPAINMYGVKESVFPFTRFSMTDTVLGPEMKSTGEVMGYGKTFSEAFYKSQIAAGMNLPDKPGSIIISLNLQDKELAYPAIKTLNKMGYKFLATSGTYKYLKTKKVKAKLIQKIGTTKPDILDAIHSGKIKFIINTPGGRKAFSDGFMIRRHAYLKNVPLYTTIRGVEALIKALSIKKLNVYTIN